MQLFIETTYLYLQDTKGNSDLHCQLYSPRAYRSTREPTMQKDESTEH